MTENVGSLGSSLKTLSEPDSAEGPSRADGWQGRSTCNQAAPDPAHTGFSETPSPGDRTLPDELCFQVTKGETGRPAPGPAPPGVHVHASKCTPSPGRPPSRRAGCPCCTAITWGNGRAQTASTQVLGGRSQAHRRPGGDPRPRTRPCPAEHQVGPCLSLPLSLSIPATQRKQAAHVTRTEPSCLINPTSGCDSFRKELPFRKKM